METYPLGLYDSQYHCLAVTDNDSHTTLILGGKEPTPESMDKEETNYKECLPVSVQ